MPFWSRGGSEEKSKGETNYASDDLSSFSSSDTNFAAGAGASGSEDPMMSAATGLGDMQQFSLALRQQMMVQTVINTLSDKVWMCVITICDCLI